MPSRGNLGITKLPQGGYFIFIAEGAETAEVGSDKFILCELWVLGGSRIDFPKYLLVYVFIFTAERAETTETGII